MDQQTARQRINTLFLFLLVLFGLMLLGYLYWSVVRAPFLADQADNPRDVERELRIQRGEIFDTNDEPVVITGMDGDFPTRDYLYPSFASAVGYYSFRFGVSGIERTLDNLLRGDSDSFQAYWQQDILHRPQAGGDVRLTLNKALQNSAAEAISGKTGAILLFSARDGNVRSLTSQPSFDPNLIDQNFELLVEDENSPLLNRATQNRYQPGNILFPLLLLRGLESGALSTADVESLSLEQLIDLLASEWDEEELLNQLEALGLFQEPDIGLETSGIALDRETFAVESMSRELNGEGNLLITPLQVARATLFLSSTASEADRDPIAPPMRLIGATREHAEVPWVTYTPLETEADAAETELVTEVQALHQELVLTRFSESELFSEWTSRVDAGPGLTNSWYIGYSPAKSPRAIVVLVLENEPLPETATQIGRTLLSQALE